MKRLSSCGLLLLGASMIATSARAGDSATAQALFDEGKRFMAQHDYAAACRKFEESQRDDPGIGTLFHVADCDERIGKTASAWAAFRAVAAEARAHAETQRASVASDRAQALEGKLARVTIEPGSAEGTPGLQILRDGSPVEPAELSTGLPVDPGAHVIEARAPGKETWSTTVTALAGARLLVTVPLLADARAELPRAEPIATAPPPSALPVAEAPPDPSTSTTFTTSAELASAPPGRAQRATGLVVGAAGLAGLGVGAYFGVLSLDRHRDAEPHCSGNVCDATGVSLRDDARRAGDAATVALAGGGALLLGGVITYAMAPRGSEYRPTVAVGPGSLMISGRW